MTSHGSIMADIDKAAIVFSIAIALIGVGIAVAGNSVDNSPAISTPTVSSDGLEEEMHMDETMMDETMMDETMMDETMMDETMMDETMMDETMMDETMMDETMMDETMMDEPSEPTTHVVDIPTGTSVPGCEESNTCYLPADITINAGDTVEWMNIDTAAHTVTSGSPANGPSGVFDSSLVLADASFAFTFNDVGNHNYFCIVHPWMAGSVTVN